MNKTDATRLNLATVMPALTVGDLEASIAFYCDILGFEVDERHEQDGKVVYASVCAGDVSLVLGQDDWAQGRDRVKGVGFRLYCTARHDVNSAIAARPMR